MFGGSNLNPPKQVEAVQGSNLSPPEQGETVQGRNLNPPGKLDYLGYNPEKLLETLETEPLYVVTLFNCISQEKGAMVGRTGQDVQQKQQPSQKLFINKSNESVSNKQENVPI